MGLPSAVGYSEGGGRGGLGGACFVARGRSWLGRFGPCVGLCGVTAAAQMAAQWAWTADAAAAQRHGAATQEQEGGIAEGQRHKQEVTATARWQRRGKRVMGGGRSGSGRRVAQRGSGMAWQRAAGDHRRSGSSA